MAGTKRPSTTASPSCYVKYNNVLLPVNVVKFNIGHLCLLCRFHKGFALLGKRVRRHPVAPVASTSRTSLDAQINAWGSVSNLHACSGFRGNKKVEKHWPREFETECLPSLRKLTGQN